MEIAAEPPMGRPEAPVMHGQRIDWTPKDVLFGALWFIFLFLLAPLPFVLPFLGVYGRESAQFILSAVIVSAFSEVGILIVGARYTWVKYGGSWERLGFWTPSWSTFGWAAAALFGAFIWSAAYGVGIEVFDVDWLKAACDEQIPAHVQDDVWLLVVVTIFAVSFAPICEEVFFRGFIFPALARWGVPAAIVVSGALFGIAHQSYKTFIPIFGIGMIFALAYFKSGNILTTVLAHFAYNCISVSTLWVGDCEPS
jgi:membrane protease YdiL (CAAX protease family)